MRSAVLIALCSLGAAHASLETRVTLTGKHYRLDYEGTRADAARTLAVLEAAWPRYRAFFRAAPKLGKGERLRVVFRQTRAGFEAAIRADKTTPPSGAGGYYWPPTRTAYLYRQPTAYYTRALLLHEAGHQFHYLARTGNISVASWYAEGVAEYLAWHWWDGETLTLGAVPLSLKDYPARALKDLQSGAITLQQLVDGKKGHRPLGSQVVRYLAEKRPKAWRVFSARMDARRDPGKTFRALFGEPARAQPVLVRWLKSAQEPVSQLFNTWERIAERHFRGDGGGVVTAARVKGATRSVTATLAIPAGRWRGGLLLHHTDGASYTVATVDSGRRIRVMRRGGGRWTLLHDGPAPAPRTAGVYRLAARRAADGVRFSVDDTTVGPFVLPGQTLGLSLEACRLDFRDVRWTPAK